MCSRTVIALVAASWLIACSGSGGGNTDAGPVADAGAADAFELDSGGEEAGCPAYHVDCHGACVVTAVDPNHCGFCDNECSNMYGCSAGICLSTCIGGMDICDNRCIDTAVDSDHCNGCGNACGPGKGCVEGTCVDTLAPVEDADACDDDDAPVVSDGESDYCAGALAEQVFGLALCSCNDIVATNPMLTDGYSSLKSYFPDGSGGGIGLNGSFSATSEVTTYGDLLISTSDGLYATDPVEVALDLRVGGPVESFSTFSVGGDAHIEGDLSATDEFNVAGSLRMPADATITGEDVSFGSRVDDDSEVQQPCACDSDSRVPVSQLVAWAATDNDNDAIGLAPNALVAPGAPTRLDLRCGTYYLTSIDATSPTVVWAHGRTSIFVEGSVTSSSNLQIRLDPDAELNIFVGGTITADSTLSIGSVLYPALSRVYVAGNDEIALEDLDLNGFLYAGNALVSVHGPVDIFGGIFADDYEAGNPITIHYDKEVQSVGVDCNLGGV